MPHSVMKKEAVCIGILAADPLRSIGLQTILEEGLKLRTVILQDGCDTRNCKPSVLIVDESYDEPSGPPGQAGPSRPLSQVLPRMPGVAVIVLTRAEGSMAAHAAMAAGARAVLPETAEPPEIRACLRAVLRGETWTPRETAAIRQETVDVPPVEDESLTHRLTPKEREVMQWLTQARSNREIALTMGIDEATVKAHLGRMLRKADATNRVELTLRALAERKALK